MLRRAYVILLTAVVVLSASGSASAREPWKERIDKLIGRRNIGVAVREDGRRLYLHSARRRRIPASNQKLLMSMALLDALGPTTRIRTSALIRPTSGGDQSLTRFFIGVGPLGRAPEPVVEGDLWIQGRGDPTIAASRAYAEALAAPATRVGDIARAIRDSGIERVRGSVMGATNYFSHDWWAPGWEPYFPSDYIAIPTALSVDGNRVEGRHIGDPELRFARALTRKLEAMGIPVRHAPGTGVPPSDAITVAQVESAPLKGLLRHTNRASSNFFAEMLGKRLSVEVSGRPGTIAKGAAAIAAWTSKHGVEIVARDSSGLSYQNRVSPGGLTKLLGIAEKTSWARELFRSLPTGDEGTLEDRLSGVPVRAKTGTLENISALSGWVWLRGSEVWAEFSILSRGMPKDRAADIEDRIVRTLVRYAGRS